MHHKHRRNYRPNIVKQLKSLDLVPTYDIQPGNRAHLFSKIKTKGKKIRNEKISKRKIRC